MNIYDIAKLANVSIATVSRVVNNSPKVSPKTKEKVLAVMKENEYTPNAFARGLGLGSMKTVGIKQEEKVDYVRLLLSKKIDTLILVGSTYAENGKDESDTDYIREAAEQVSVFMINAKVSGDNIYCTYADDFQATYEVTKAFIRRGKEKILFMYDSESYSARQKMAGYEAALQDAGYPIRGNLKFKTRNDIEYTRDMLLEYNRTLDFDSVLATEDGIAIGAVKYAKIKGLVIPEELAVAGYNNSILAISSDPELTSVDSKLGVMCKKTVERMIDLLEREIQIEKNVCVPCEIVRRCTTDF